MFTDLKSNKEHFSRSLKVAAPCIFENIMISMVSLVDTALVGKLGKTATAAVAINSSPMWLLNSLSTGLAVGGTVLVARHIGAGERREANEVSSSALSAGVFLGLLLTFIILIFRTKIPAIMGASSEVLPYAVSFLSVYSLSLALHFGGLVASGLLRGAGNTVMPMFVSLMTNVVNVVLNLLLIYPSRPVNLFGLNFTVFGAGYGVVGSAMATSIAQAFSGLVLMALLFGRNQQIHIKFRELFKVKFNVLKRILTIGLPSAGERVAICLGHVLFQRMIANLGTVEIAAHYLATTAESISYMPANGFAVASTTLVGQSLGAKNKKDAEAYAKINIYFSLLLGILSSALLLLFPFQLLRLFTNDPDVIRQGAYALRTIAVVEPVFCLSIVYIGILRGAGDTVMPLVAAIVGMWGIRQLATYVFAYVLGFGLIGAWVGMGIDIVIRCAILHMRYRKKKWLEIEL